MKMKGRREQRQGNGGEEGGERKVKEGREEGMEGGMSSLLILGGRI